MCIAKYLRLARSRIVLDILAVGWDTHASPHFSVGACVPYIQQEYPERYILCNISSGIRAIYLSLFSEYILVVENVIGARIML